MGENGVSCFQPLPKGEPIEAMWGVNPHPLFKEAASVGGLFHFGIKSGG
jgi:hypothetical protein